MHFTQNFNFSISIEIQFNMNLIPYFMKLDQDFGFKITLLNGKTNEKYKSSLRLVDNKVFAQVEFLTSIPVCELSIQIPDKS